MAPPARWTEMDSPVKPANDSGRYLSHRSLPQPHAGATAVFVDEFDACGLKSLALLVELAAHPTHYQTRLIRDGEPVGVQFKDNNGK